MHRKSVAKLLSLDIEIEKTLRNLKKVRESEKAAMRKENVIKIFL